MSNTAHKIFILFLLLIGIVTAVSIFVRNYSYYQLPLDQRPFNQRYDSLKPSGMESHGYGIIGTAMIVVGVTMYSSRKRIRRFAHLGRIKHVLEFHIFLCLLGPVLILYHTTFKFGGLVAVSFWSMSAVVASGIIGRYLYQHIPKNIEGNELTSKELEDQNAQLFDSLRSTFGLPEKTVAEIDAIAMHNSVDNDTGIVNLLWSMIVSDFSRLRRTSALKKLLRSKGIDKKSIKQIIHVAHQRIVLVQRTAALEKLQQIFHYWHVIHLPFSIVMFVILVIHIGVAVTFGYTWIF